MAGGCSIGSTGLVQNIPFCFHQFLSGNLFFLVLVARHSLVLCQLLSVSSYFCPLEISSPKCLWSALLLFSYPVPSGPGLTWRHLERTSNTLSSTHSSFGFRPLFPAPAWCCHLGLTVTLTERNHYHFHVISLLLHLALLFPLITSPFPFLSGVTRCDVMCLPFCCPSLPHSCRVLRFLLHCPLLFILRGSPSSYGSKSSKCLLLKIH